MVIIYNPKMFEGKPSQPISYPWEGKVIKLAVNDWAKFPDELGRELLKNYGFLEEVKPENLPDIQKRMTANVFVCEYCQAEFYSAKELTGHKTGKHKLSKETEDALKAIPEAIEKTTDKKPDLDGVSVDVPETPLKIKGGNF